MIVTYFVVTNYTTLFNLKLSKEDLIELCLEFVYRLQ